MGNSQQNGQLLLGISRALRHQRWGVEAHIFVKAKHEVKVLNRLA